MMMHFQLDEIKYAEFCAGIGGFRTGISMSKHSASCVYKNEIDDRCERTYFDNFGELFDSKDIFAINASALPEFDMLCSGFPCQPFSNAGARQGFLDKRGQVIFKLLEIISVKNPPIVFLENVPNLARHERGKSLSLIIKSLEDFGYIVHAKIIDSIDFGLPQRRPRLYIVAFQSDAFGHISYSFPSGTPFRRTIRSILNTGDYSIPITKKWNEYIDLYSNAKSVQDLTFVPPKTRTQLERIASDCDLEDCIFQIRSSGIRAYSLDGQYPTFAVSNSGGGAMIPVLSKERRHLSLIEIKRLMGFNDEFVFTINRTDSIKQLANAVCPPVISGIYNSIIHTIRGSFSKTYQEKVI